MLGAMAAAPVAAAAPAAADMVEETGSLLKDIGSILRGDGRDSGSDKPRLEGVHGGELARRRAAA